MVLADSDGVSPAPPYSGYPPNQKVYVYRAFTFYGLTFQKGSTWFLIFMQVLQPRSSLNYFGLGYSTFARHYLQNHYCFLFLRVLRCFSSPGLLLTVTGLQPAGLPHSEIRGSIRICQSPRHIAAYHVFRRLWEPRHPPYALIYFLLTRMLLIFFHCSF